MKQAGRASFRSFSFEDAFEAFLAQCRSIGGRLEPDDVHHLRRWLEDSRAKAVWEAVQRRAWGPIGNYDPLEGFIPKVLLARLIATKLRTLMPRLRKQKLQRLRNEKFALNSDERAKFWADMADSKHPMAVLALQRAKYHEEEAALFRKLVERKRQSSFFHVSRIDKSGSRRQRVFMEIMGNDLVQLCGRAMDTQVAVLNDIAFDTADATHPYQARAARRAKARTKPRGGKNRHKI